MASKPLPLDEEAAAHVAIVHGLVLLTSDECIARYPARVVG